MGAAPRCGPGPQLSYLPRYLPLIPRFGDRPNTAAHDTAEIGVGRIVTMLAETRLAIAPVRVDRDGMRAVAVEQSAQA